MTTMVAKSRRTTYANTDPLAGRHASLSGSSPLQQPPCYASLSGFGPLQRPPCYASLSGFGPLQRPPCYASLSGLGPLQRPPRCPPMNHCLLLLHVPKQVDRRDDQPADVGAVGGGQDELAGRDDRHEFERALLHRI